MLRFAPLQYIREEAGSELVLDTSYPNFYYDFVAECFEICKITQYHALDIHGLNLVFPFDTIQKFSFTHTVYFRIFNILTVLYRNFASKVLSLSSTLLNQSN